MSDGERFPDFGTCFLNHPNLEDFFDIENDDDADNGTTTKDFGVNLLLNSKSTKEATRILALFSQFMEIEA